MEEQLISFETAKLAKEKGFDINDTKYIHYKSKIHEPHTLFPRNSAAMADGDIKEYYSAPTQSLLQRWLREKNNACVTVIPDYNKKIIFACSIHIIISGMGGLHTEIIRNKDNQIKYYNTYEKALEEGLLTGLKLI